MDFWERVKAAIKSQNTTQEWLASKIGITQSALSSSISRNQMPSVERAAQIARALGVTTEYLVTGEDPQQPPEKIRALVKILEQLPEADQEEILAIARLKLNRK